MTFYYDFHGDDPHLGVIKLFINTELTTRHIWSGHDITSKSRRKVNFVKDCALNVFKTSVLETLCNSIVLYCQQALRKANSMWGKKLLKAKADNLQRGCLSFLNFEFHSVCPGYEKKRNYAPFLSKPFLFLRYTCIYVYFQISYIIHISNN